MTQEKLNEIINEYSDTKKQLDELKKQSDKLNLIIKDSLSEMGLDEYAGKCYTVSRSVINTDKLDEDALIGKLRNTMSEEVVNQVIVTKEFLDLDKLEDLVYNRVIKADVVDSCIIHKKPTVRLNIKATKEENDG